MRALLDVNVLIALLDVGHIHHHLASSWLEREILQGWASCPIYYAKRLYTHHVPTGLPRRTSRDRGGCAFVRSSFSSCILARRYEPVRFTMASILGHRQITDLYLLALAVKHNGRFVTFDQRITLQAVSGATEQNLFVLR